MSCLLTQSTHISYLEPTLWWLKWVYPHHHQHHCCCCWRTPQRTSSHWWRAWGVAARSGAGLGRRRNQPSGATGRGHTNSFARPKSKPREGFVEKAISKYYIKNPFFLEPIIQVQKYSHLQFKLSTLIFSIVILQNKTDLILGYIIGNYIKRLK